jgi:uncharacterized protein (DUF58 family)
MKTDRCSQRLKALFRRFLRLTRADDRGRAIIAPRRIYILPTRYGIGYAFLLLLMLVGSINYASNLGFLLTFLLVGMGLITMIHTWRNLVGLELSAGRAQPVFCGQDCCFSIQLKNHRAGPRPGIQLQTGRESPAATDLEGRASASLTLSQATRWRGEAPLSRVTVSTRYPLGLLRAWAYVELDARCLVYPAPGPRVPWSGVTDYRHSPKGDRGVGADDFVGLRPYRPGDAPHHINWKALAREQGLQTKQFGGDRSEQLWLDWNQTEGDTEARLRALCRGVLDACEQQLDYGLRLPDTVFGPGRSQAHRRRCLAALARFGALT